MKKSICIDCFSPLPVPAIKGGAVETLLTILLEENEKLQRINLIIVCAADKEAQKNSNKYKCSKVIYVRKNDFVKRIYNKVVGVLNRILHREQFLVYDYVMENKVLKRINADYYLTTGCGSHYSQFVKQKGIDNVICYLHTEVKATEETDAIFKKALGVSNYVTETFYKTSKWERSNGRVVLNCTDETCFNKSLDSNEKNKIRKLLGLEKNDFVILYTGRINEDKGVHVLIDAINSIEDRAIKLVICGGTNFDDEKVRDYQKSIIEYVEDSKGRIVYAGYIEHSALYKYYSIADIQVIPSLWEEAAGLVVIEGMYSGLPLIITNSGGMGEYATKECAITVNRDEKLVENMAANILLLKNNQLLRERMSIAGKERAKVFTREKFYNDFVDVLDNWN